jgi:hypothetical protein
MSLLASAIATSHRGFPLFQYAANILRPSDLRAVCPRLILTNQPMFFPILELCSHEFDAIYVLFQNDTEAKRYALPKNVYALNNTYHYIGDTGRIVTSDLDNRHADIYVVHANKLPTTISKDKTYIRGTNVMDLRFTNGSRVIANEFGHPGYQKDRIYYE